MALTLYQYEISPFCDKVRRALAIKGLVYQTVEVLPSRRNQHRMISPTGKYPALVDDGRIIVDSTDILDYLEDRFPEPSLTPAAPRERALAAILEDWADESLYFYDLTMRNWPQNRAWFLDDLLRHESRVMQAILRPVIPAALRKVAQTQGLARKAETVVTAELGRLYDALEALLDGAAWLAAPALSRADLAVFVMLNVLDRTVEGERLKRARPKLADWFARVDAASSPPGISRQ